MKHRQNKVLEKEKLNLMMKKRESAENAESFLSLRKSYRQPMVSNLAQIFLNLSYFIYYTTLDERLDLNTSIIFSLGITMLALGTFFHFRHYIKKSKEWLRPYCLFTSLSAGECLDSGDKVRSAFFAERLFEYFPMFAKNTKVKIHPWETDLAKMLEYDVEEVYRSRTAIGSAIMVGKTETLSDAFYTLADELFSKENPSNFDAIQESLQKLIASTKEYRPKKLTFLDKHPYLKNTLIQISEYTKLTIALAIPFMLWLIFGYGG